VSAHCVELLAGGTQRIRPSRGSLARLHLDDFERWRPRVARFLRLGAAFLVAYWLAWFVDRESVAVAHTGAYDSFEQAFPLADGLLALAAVVAALSLSRRRPGCLVWLAVVGGAGTYLCALDLLYDLEHGVYATGSAGLLELGINLITGVGSLGLISFAWRFRRELSAFDG
jgi:hypothetical protein